MADIKNEREELRTLEDLFRQKRFSEALKIVQKASHDYPNSFQIRFLYVRILKEINKLKEAEEILNQLMLIYPNNITLLIESGSLSTLQNKFDEALENYHKILFLDPFNTEAKNAIEKISIIKQNGFAGGEKPVDFVSYQKEKLHTADTLPEFDSSKLRHIIREEPPVPPPPPPIPELDEWGEKNEPGGEEFPEAEPFNINIDLVESGEELETPLVPPLPFEEEQWKHEAEKLEESPPVPRSLLPPPPVSDWEEEAWKEEVNIGREDAAAVPELSPPPLPVSDWEEALKEEDNIGIESAAGEPEPLPPPTVSADWEAAWEEKDQNVAVKTQWEEEIPGIEAEPEESLEVSEEENIEEVLKEEAKIVTASAAELYVKQGLLEDALAIYKKLYDSQKEKRYLLKINQLNHVLVNQTKIQVLTELLKRIKQRGIGEQIV